MFSCRRATTLISDGLDRSLSLADRLRLGVHLLGCPPCRRFRRALHWLHRTLGTPCPCSGHPQDTDKVALSAEARERIGRALEQATGRE